MRANLTLLPFPVAGGQIPGYGLGVSVERREQSIAIDFALSGDLATIQFPELADKPERRDELWRQTCFEFFLARPESPSYWECNLSPAGHWNLYRFNDYRQGMVAEPALTALPIRVLRTPELFGLSLEFDLGLLGLGQLWQVGVSAVIQEKNGPIAYWALNHPGLKPDFHHREAFTVGI